MRVLAPYLIAFLTQVGAIVGQQIAKPQRGVATPAAGRAQAEFDTRFDLAQTVPSMMTLVVSSLALAGDLGPQMTTITVVVAVLLMAVLLGWLYNVEADAYAERSLFGLVSPVSGIFMAATVALGAIAYFVVGPARS